MSNPVINALLKHLIPILEDELIKHEPEVQDVLLAEAKELIVKVDEWISDKVKARE